ncbi:MAG: cell division protein FtsW [Candidatus Harrisonbacteria bacterium]|nr:cell division protein FtsW [Candidatus Harrisonbacteria bacterium]
MSKRKPDYLILSCVGALVVFGLVILASASANLGQEKFSDSFYYLNHQLVHGFSVGLIGFFAGISIYYKRYQKFAFFLLLVSIGAVVLVFTPLGFKAGGADRWVAIGPITFQPAEIVKLTFIIYLAAWLARSSERYRNFKKGFLPFLALLAIVAAPLLKQPATTTVIIIAAAALIVYFVSGARFSYIFGAVVLGAAALGMIVYLTPYRLERITNFLQPNSDPLAGGYHLNQAQIAIGSGGLIGVGYGESTTKIAYLPEPIGDSIFAVIGEELGFVGSVSLIAIFAVLVLKIFLLAKRTGDKFGKFLLVGFGSIIGVQVFINIAAISGIIPLTGVPLPFISFGGTALAVFMTMGGVVVNISRYS